MPKDDKIHEVWEFIGKTLCSNSICAKLNKDDGDEDVLKHNQGCSIARIHFNGEKEICYELIKNKDKDNEDEKDKRKGANIEPKQLMFLHGRDNKEWQYLSYVNR